MQGIPEGALKPIPTQLAFVLHVTNRRLNGTASVNGFLDRWGDTAFLAAAPDCHTADAHPTIALVDKDRLRFLRGEQAHLLDGFR